MQYTSKQYAYALNSALKEKSLRESEVILNNFIKILKKKKDFKKINFIEQELENIYLKENNLLKAEITSSHPLSSLSQEKIKKFVERFWGKRDINNSIILENKVDSNLIGGMQIKTRDYLIDGSVKSSFLKLRKNMQI